VDADLDTLATALYVKIDELLAAAPQLAPWRPAVGIAPKLSDAELVTLAVMQVLLGFTSEARCCAMPTTTCGTCSPTCLANPATTSACAGQQGCCVMPSAPSLPTPRCGPTTSGWPTPPRWSAAAPGHRQAFGPGRVGLLRLVPQPFALVLGLRLHLVCTLHGLPVLFALTGANAVDREVLAELLAVEPELVAARPGQVLIADKNYYGREFEAGLAEVGVRLLRPARKGEPHRTGGRLLRPLRQLIESVNDTFKGQLDLERHGGHTLLASGFGSCNASWPSPQPSGTTTPPTSRPCAPWSPTITDPLESIV
jgi:hypothetical protein